MNAPRVAASCRHPRLLRCGAGSVAVLVLAAGVVAGYLHSGLESGRDLADGGRFAEAEAAVSRYLRLWPSDAEGRLLAAEILVRSTDEMKETDEAVRAVDAAVRHLDRVPDTSPGAAEARLRAARLAFLLQRRPVEAEGRLRRAIALEPDNYQAHLLLWSVLDMTQRPEEVEPIFRRVVELSPARDRPAHLRHWHMTQFAPAAVCLDIDRQMGVLTPTDPPTLQSNMVRFETFRAAEPAALLHAANIATALDRAGLSRDALAELDRLPSDAASTDRFVAAARAEVAFSLSDTAALAACVENWPEPRAGHRYLRWRGIALEEAAGDYARALAAFDETLTRWPGSLDWQLAFRKANCLQRLGRADEAEATRARAMEIERLTAKPEQTRVGELLNDLNDADGIAAVADFYDAIGRPFEAALWRDQVELLRRAKSRPAASLWP